LRGGLVSNEFAGRGHACGKAFGSGKCLHRLARTAKILKQWPLPIRRLKRKTGRPNCGMETLPGQRLIVADDHPLFRDAMRGAIASALNDVRIDEAGSFDELMACLADNREADLILLDLTMPGVSGFSGLIYLRAQHADIPVVVVSASDDVPTIRRAIDFGASGFIPKRLGADMLRAAVKQVLAGDIWTPPDIDLSDEGDPEAAKLRDRLNTLTPQQVRVLMMLSEGLLNKQIAYELSVSEATIKAHVSAILQKLNVESRTQAVIAASKIALGQWKASESTSS